MKGRAERAWQVALAALGLAVLAVPPLVVGLSGTASTDVLWTTFRLAALEAFTLVFANIVTGAFRPLFNRIAKPRTVHRLHATTGLTGFSIAVAHGTMAVIYGISGYKTVPVWVGPATLAVLALAILGALARRRMRRTWRWIHRLNYVVFAAALVHGSIVGYDLKGTLFLKICFWVYAVVVVAGLAYRVRASLLPARPQRKPAGSQ
jgi:DMSO/TMAO reductase YedYZ heme-binding membrane subunit